MSSSPLALNPVPILNSHRLVNVIVVEGLHYRHIIDCAWRACAGGMRRDTRQGKEGTRWVGKRRNDGKGYEERMRLPYRSAKGATIERHLLLERKASGAVAWVGAERGICRKQKYGPERDYQRWVAIQYSNRQGLRDVERWLLRVSTLLLCLCVCVGGVT